jgi:hypothetical protein
MPELRPSGAKTAIHHITQNTYIFKTIDFLCYKTLLMGEPVGSLDNWGA